MEIKKLQEMITGSYYAMAGQLTSLQYENRLLRKALSKFCIEQKLNLEDVLEEMRKK